MRNINFDISTPEGKYYVAIKRVTTHIEELEDAGDIKGAKEMTYNNLLPLIQKLIEVTEK